MHEESTLDKRTGLRRETHPFSSRQSQVYVLRALFPERFRDLVANLFCLIPERSLSRNPFGMGVPENVLSHDVSHPYVVVADFWMG